MTTRISQLNHANLVPETSATDRAGVRESEIFDFCKKQQMTRLRRGESV